MPRFKVVAPLEHDKTLYIPKSDSAPVKVKSVGNGQEIPVDSSGVVDLDETYSKALNRGQVVPISEQADARPDSKRTRR